MMETHDGAIDARRREYLGDCDICEKEAIYEINQVTNDGVTSVTVCLKHMMLFLAEWDGDIKVVKKYEGTPKET